MSLLIVRWRLRYTPLLFGFKFVIFVFLAAVDGWQLVCLQQLLLPLTGEALKFGLERLIESLAIFAILLLLLVNLLLLLLDLGNMNGRTDLLLGAALGGELLLANGLLVVRFDDLQIGLVDVHELRARPIPQRTFRGAVAPDHLRHVDGFVAVCVEMLHVGLWEDLDDVAGGFNLRGDFDL